MKNLTLVISLLLLTSKSFAQWSESTTDRIFIHGGWIFDGVSEDIRKNKGILIEQGKIVHVDKELQIKAV